MWDLTPIELHSGMWFKREDKFCPKGYGHINGSKLRQCLFLVDKWHQEGGRGVVSGSVSQSPQHAFISELCRHYNMGCVIVHAKKNVIESPYLKLAKSNGAKLIKSKVGYAKTLGSMSKKMLNKLPNHHFLETNITLEEEVNSWEDIAAFHRVGAEQARNIPDNIERLIIPCGSCNSVTSIMYGLALYPKPFLKEIVLMGIGNNGSNNIGYVEHRLKHIAEVTDINIEGLFGWEGGERHTFNYHNLNGSGYCKYSDTMVESTSNIQFHPRYEGKCIRYIKENLMHYWNDRSLFWIVGSDLMRL